MMPCPLLKLRGSGLVTQGYGEDCGYGAEVLFGLGKKGWDGLGLQVLAGKLYRTKV